jgi:protein ImuB
LWFPRLPTDRLQRRWKARDAQKAQSDCDPSLKGAEDAPPLVVVAKIDNAMRLTAVDRRATSLGLCAGMTLADARAMLPALKAMAANEPADRALLEHIADWCDRYTPFVALDLPHALLLDVTGVAHLFGGEKALLDRMRTSFSKQDFAVRGAIAGTAAAARAMARYKNSAVVPPGEEARSVAPLPIEALRLDQATIHAFRRAGLKTVGQAASRKRAELTARFGAAMVFALDSALGHGEKPISPRIPVADTIAEHRFADPIVTEDAVLQSLRSLADVLAITLTKREQGARRMDAAFFRADGAVRRIAVEMGDPTRDPAVIQRLFREKLDALADPLDPGFGYDLIRLSASRVERAEAQAVDFDSDAGAEQEIRFLIDRLAARFGSHRVLSFQANDTHIPEAAWAAVPAQFSSMSKTAWEKIRDPMEAPRRPLRMFAKPEPVEVIAGLPEDPPRKFRWRRTLHDVVRVEGPERVAMEWWRHQTPQPTRDYFRVEDEKGVRFWLYRDGLYQHETLAARWYIHGVFA